MTRRAWSKNMKISLNPKYNEYKSRKLAALQFKECKETPMSFITKQIIPTKSVPPTKMYIAINSSECCLHFD